MDVEAFITRWTAREGGAERANYQMFLSDLCDVLAVSRPDPASADHDRNDYVFERAVRTRGSEAHGAPRRIDLYKKNAFILEAKQSRLPGKKNAIPGQPALPGGEPEQLGRRGVARGWDVMMQNAKTQAEGYVFLLDPHHPAPPFLMTCDVGHCLEIFADFTGTGRVYNQFPDRHGFRVYVEDLRKPVIRDRLARIWTDPHALDPAKTSARVTREIARHLAEVSKALEARGRNAEEVAHFLMRCLFTMFAEDVGLLPPDSFKSLLRKSVEDTAHFTDRLTALWRHMDEGEPYSAVVDARVRKFNGGLFTNTMVFALGRDEISELLAAANHSWTEVDPAIFGTLLEQALDRTERKKLGAHYTPRAYVQRLVNITVMEPLRSDWQAALTRARQAKEDGDEKGAVAILRGFHRQLCATRVLDPACGTGNFLYVSLELMKKLEGDVLETLAELGEPETMGLDRETVDPHQFLGLELNPRAAAIAELVVWIGYLQQHYKTRSGHPGEPILRDFKTINYGSRHGYDAVLTWDGAPECGGAEKGGINLPTYPNPKRPPWPEAAFIVGNPPFIGGKDLRSRMPAGYAEALWRAHPTMNESADFVMYWWDRAAEMLTGKKSSLRRFGFVTTNSISQLFQRRVVERHLAGKPPVSVIFAVPDHPWTKATKDSAAVRIGMTVVEMGVKDGVLAEVVDEARLDTDNPSLTFRRRSGRINADLTIGTDATKALRLAANEGLCSPGVKLHGAGFIVTRTQAVDLGLAIHPGLERHIRPYRNGRDLVSRSRDVMAIDLFGLGAETVRRSYPQIYQHLLATVKPERDRNARASYRDKWWIFGEPRRELRPALDGLPRYIATVETAKHRTFQFLDAAILPDNMLVAIASDDAWVLAVLSSRIHTTWAPMLGGWLGYGNDSRYSKSRCFDPFPFPDPSPSIKAALRAAGDELDALRKRVLGDHPDLTLTGLYNVLEKTKAKEPLQEQDEEVKQRGLVLILGELHAEIDRLTAQAYGWPYDLSDEAIIHRLVALNAARARAEAGGHVIWLRPEFQIPRFARGEVAATEVLDLGETIVSIEMALPPFPIDRYEQPLVIEAMLLAGPRSMTAAELARGFKRGGKRIETRVAQVLTTLARYGRVTVLDGGCYVARKVA